MRQAREENPALANLLTPENFTADRIHLDPNRDLRDAASVDQDLAAMRNQRNPPRAATINAVGREQRNSTTEDVDLDHAATINSQRMSRGQNPQEIASNDLLIGQGGNDTLQSHRGDDILIGGQGRDRMEGGEGRDTYVIGAGDTVMDSDGVGEVRWGGQQLTGGTRSESDPANTYRSEDGRFIYTLENNNLSVTDTLPTDQALRERAVIENFQSGQLGITLSGPGGGGARPQADPQRPDDQERRRMINDDRDHRSDIQFPAPGAELPSWEAVQARENPQAFTTGDPDLDKLATALFANDEAEISRVSAQIEQSPQVQSFEQWGRDLVAAQQREELQQQEMARQQGPVMST